MRTIPLLFVVLLALPSCLTLHPETVSVPPTARKIAVVVAIHPELSLETIGFTVFQNSLDIVDVSDWNLDDIVFETIEAKLAGRYDIVRTTADERCRIYGNFPETRCGIRPVEADLYVLVSDTSIGVHTRDIPFRSSPPTGFALASLSILDGTSFKVLASSQLIRRHKTAEFDDSPVDYIPGIIWHNYWYEFSEVDQNFVRIGLLRLLVESVANTVDRIGFDASD